MAGLPGTDRELRWVDNMKAEFLKQIIDKEKALQGEFMSRTYPDFWNAPPPATPAPKTEEKKEMPKPIPNPPSAARFFSGMDSDGLRDMISQNLWSQSCAGATGQRLDKKMGSTMKRDHAYDTARVDPVDKSAFRRRDEFTRFVEAEALQKNLMKGPINTSK
eukprot:tig00000411_g580.t1